MARVALLCWEIGGGLGHIASLIEVSRALKARGWSCIFAFPPSRAAARLMPRGSDIRAAPSWRQALPDDFLRTGSSATMADMLADTGLRSAEGTRTQILGWHLLFAECLPDVVIADHAPGALLAARGRIAAAAVGTGYSVPPAGLPRFPPLHDLAPPRDDETALLETANAVLEKFGAPPLAVLSDALTGDAALACTLPLLDPYAPARTEPVLPPLLGGRVPPEAGAPAEAVVCYFQPGAFRGRLAKLADVLTGLPFAVRLLVPSLSKMERVELEAAGIAAAPAGLETDPFSGTRLMIHAGGHGVAAAAVLAGIPQVVLDYDVEKELTGRALAKRGVAKRFDFDDASVEEMRQGIVAAASDDAFRAVALEAAAENVAFRRLDAAERVAERCVALSG